jgi:molybdate transport system ATP-binding protein
MAERATEAERSLGLVAEFAQPGPIPLAAQLRVAPGELHALIGPSGSGKTTLLRALAGLYRPRHGRIVCAGEFWLDTAAGRDLSPQRRRVGLVFQHYALFPHLSAEENVAAALTDLPRAARGKRARALLAQMGLAAVAARRPAMLSGGEQQRVALARALARAPALLLLDEPFAALDTRTRRHLRQELAALHRGLAIPVVLVTHDLEEAAALASQMTVLAQGRTLQTGPPREIMTRPASLAIARVVDLQNLFEGAVVIKAAAGATSLAWRGLRIEAAADPLPPGAEIAWTVAPAAISWADPGGAAGEGRAGWNIVRGRVGEVAALPGVARVTFIADGTEEAAFVFPCPPPGIGPPLPNPGARAAIGFPAAAVHLMALSG